MPPKPSTPAGQRIGLPEGERHQLAEAQRRHREVVPLEAQAGEGEQQPAEGGERARGGEGEQPRPPQIDRAHGTRVRAEADEGGMAERHLTGVAEEQREADHDHGVDAGEREDLEQEAVGHHQRQHGHDGDGHEWSERPERARVHQTFTRPEPPNRPCGRTNRTTRRTTTATPSL